jgi:hypothetical protein
MRSAQHDATDSYIDKAAIPTCINVIEPPRDVYINCIISCCFQDVLRIHSKRASISGKGNQYHMF